MKRTCVQCSGRLPVTARADARFCSGACRQAAYRARRSGVPECMRERSRWVRWTERRRGAKVTKVPLDLAGRDLDVRDARRWVSFDEARRSKVGSGLGIVLGDGLGCIDLDDCIVDGAVAEWARVWIDRCRDNAVLIERSFSGAGVHIFLPMPEGPGRRIRDGVRKVEVYSRDRYIAVTGERI